jgi:hypothetical protein
MRVTMFVVEVAAGDGVPASTFPLWNGYSQFVYDDCGFGWRSAFSAAIGLLSEDGFSR